MNNNFKLVRGKEVFVEKHLGLLLFDNIEDTLLSTEQEYFFDWRFNINVKLKKINQLGCFRIIFFFNEELFIFYCVYFTHYGDYYKIELVTNNTKSGKLEFLKIGAEIPEEEIFNNRFVDIRLQSDGCFITVYLDGKRKCVFPIDVIYNNQETPKVIDDINHVKTKFSFCNCKTRLLIDRCSISTFSNGNSLDLILFNKELVTENKSIFFKHDLVLTKEFHLLNIFKIIEDIDPLIDNIIVPFRPWKNDIEEISKHGIGISFNNQKQHTNIFTMCHSRVVFVADKINDKIEFVDDLKFLCKKIDEMFYSVLNAEKSFVWKKGDIIAIDRQYLVYLLLFSKLDIDYSDIYYLADNEFLFKYIPKLLVPYLKIQ